MSCPGQRARYQLTLEDLPAAPRAGTRPPAAIRLRQLLKALLRTYGFRCLEAKGLPAEGDGARAT